MKALYDLKEKLCGELDEIARKPEMSAGDLETTHKLTDTVKNIDKILMLEGEDGYSGDGDWEARGSYNRGNSYAGRKRDSMGRYSRDDRGMAYRDGMHRYSRDGGKDEIMEHLEKAMVEASSEKEREAIRRCMKQVESE